METLDVVARRHARGQPHTGLLEFYCTMPRIVSVGHCSARGWRSVPHKLRKWARCYKLSDGERGQTVLAFVKVSSLCSPWLVLAHAYLAFRRSSFCLFFFFFLVFAVGTVSNNPMQHRREGFRLSRVPRLNEVIATHNTEFNSFPTACRTKGKTRVRRCETSAS